MKLMSHLIGGLLIVSCLGSAQAQSSQSDYNICFNFDVDHEVLMSEAITQGWIFPCSKIAADAALPVDMRSSALARRGLAYARRDLEKGLLDFREAIRLDPKNSLPHKLLAFSYAAFKHDYENALKSADTGIRVNPKDPELYVLRGRMLVATRKDEKGLIEELRKARSVAPPGSRAAVQIDMMLKERGVAP